MIKIHGLFSRHRHFEGAAEGLQISSGSYFFVDVATFMMGLGWDKNVAVHLLYVTFMPRCCCGDDARRRFRYH